MVIMSNNEKLTENDMLLYKRVSQYDVKISSIKCFELEKFTLLEKTIDISNLNIMDVELTNA